MSVVDDIVKKIKDWFRENPEVIVGALLLMLASYLIASFWHQLITEHYFALQVVLTTVMAVLIVEIVTITDPKGVMKELRTRDKTSVQIVILGGLVFTAFISNWLIWWVEDAFGRVLLVQLLGILVIISRLYVNVSAPTRNTVGRRKDNDTEVFLGIFDGQTDTYAVYLFGIIAIFLPLAIQRIYPLSDSVMSSVTLGTAIFFFRLATTHICLWNG